MPTRKPFDRNLLTTRDVCYMFDVTPMTIHIWRKNEGFPTRMVARDSGANKRPNVRFDLEAVKKWAAKTGRTVKREPTTRKDLRDLTLAKNAA